MAGNDEAGPSTASSPPVAAASTPAAHASSQTLAATPSASAASPATGPASSQSNNVSASTSTQPRPNMPDLAGIARRLTNPEAEMASRANAAQEFRDLLELFHNNSYGHYVAHFVPAAIKALSTIPTSLQTDAAEQRARLTLLETLHRLPQLEQARSQAKELMRLMIEIVREDNEDNACVAIKVIIDLHRHLKAELEQEVEPFLDLVAELYRNFKTVIAAAFDGDANPQVSTLSRGGDGAEASSSPVDSQYGAGTGESSMGLGMGMQAAQPKTLAKSFSSFKVLTECPITTVFILQTYKEDVSTPVQMLLPLTVEECLSQQAKAQREAHEAAKEKGTIFVGVAPGIKNRALFTEMVAAQVKTMSFLAYVVKGFTKAIDPYKQIVPEIAVRLLRDCPPEAVSLRKDLLVAIRHIFTTQLRASFVSQIDTLLDQRVLLGTGIATRESLRPLAISMLADLVHHIRNELSYDQIVLTVRLHCQMLHDPTLAPSILTMCTKLLANLVETIASRHLDNAYPLLRTIFEAFVEKLGSLPRLREDFETLRAHKKSPETTHADAVTIERSKVVQVNVMIPDLGSGSEPFKDARFLLRNILLSIKALLTKMRAIGAPEPDSDIIARLLVDGIRSWSLHDQAEQIPDKESMECFTNIFVDLEPQTFHEVFSTKMPFIVEQILSNGMLLGVPQSLLSSELTSKRFVAILLRYLVDHLGELGNTDKKNASVSLRLFKMAFMAVTIFPDANEVILQPHLSHIIMSSMKHAQRADEPNNYFLLLRALFRSIGGGRFELLYKDVLPLLPVVLENLNNFLNAAEPSRKELFVDLCLTVPVRLSVLLPYLGYLMQPLVLALQSSTDLVSQGLRTLELCIDNLTQEFLDPIMAPYAYDIMSALWKHLQPLPHNHQHSHTTMRILGKMGGRNRRLLQQAPRLEHHSSMKLPTIPIQFDGKAQTISLLPIIELSLDNIRKGDVHFRKQSLQLLKSASVVCLDGMLHNEGAYERDGHFERTVEGLFGATLVEEIADDAKAYLKSLARHVISLEAKRENTSRQFSQVTLSFFEGIISALASLESDAKDQEAIIELERELVMSFREVCRAIPRVELFSALCHSLASKHCGLCYDQLWQRKTGGWLGVDMLVRRAEMPRNWVRDHQLEVVRALLYMLKDMPSEAPRNVDAVADTLEHVLRTVNMPLSDEEKKAAESETPEEKLLQDRQFSFVVGVLLTELSSSNSRVRETARMSFQLLADLKDESVNDILMPVKDRLLTPIFQKPLRALPFGMQIGHIDAINFCLQLKPPLPDFNEELYRVLTEALALAEAEDQALIGRASTSQYKNMVAVTQLRVVAIRLLASALACPEFEGLASRHQNMRLKIIAVYFKSLYSRSEVVIDTAYDCLKETLQTNPKLPKDVLQSGLRPILMTLADASRLTMAGLDGLARVLELLTSYFKVEIGLKLLSHLEVIAQPAVIERASRGDLDGPLYAESHQLLQPRQPRESEPIETMAAIVRVFHLLPPAANTFMDRLVGLVVRIETMLRRSGPTPFTKPLAHFVNKNANQSLDVFFEHVEDANYLRCFKHLLGSPHAPQLRETLDTQAEDRLLPLLRQSEHSKILASLMLVEEMDKNMPKWLTRHTEITDEVLSMWNRPEIVEARRADSGSRENSLAVRMSHVLCRTIEQTEQPRVEFFCALADLFTTSSPFDYTAVLRRIYQRFAVEGSVELKRQALTRFIDMFEDKALDQNYKAKFLRVIVNPMLVVTPRPATASASAVEAKAGDDVEMKEADKEVDESVEKSAAATSAEPLFTADILGQIIRRIWKLFVVNPKANRGLWSNDLFRVELLNMSTLVLEHCAELLSGSSAAFGRDESPRKDAIKFGWTNIGADDILVKNSAYIFVARFLELFESPAKLILQIYVGLLRSQQAEGRSLIRKALDILLPALPRRMPYEAGKVPDWIKVTKRQLVQEGNNIAQLFSILQLLTRHADLFYPAREHFLSTISSSLTKLGLAQTSSLETRHLAVEMVDLVMRWERKRREALDEKSKDDDGADSSGQKRGAEDGAIGTRKRVRLDEDANASEAPTGGAAAPYDEHEYALPLSIRETFVGFLLRYVSLSTESVSRGGTTHKAFIMLKELLSTDIWRDIAIKLAIFQRPLVAISDIKEQNIYVVTNSLQTLRLVIKDKQQPWVLAHMPQIHKLLEKSLQCEEPVILDSCRGILEKVFDVLSPVKVEETDKDVGGEEGDDMEMTQSSKSAETTGSPVSDSTIAFRAFVDGLVSEGLKTPGGSYSALMILSCWSKSDPAVLDAHIVAITKTLTKLTKDHITAAHPVSVHETGLRMLITTLDLLKSRILHLGDQRRWFLSALVQLVERTSTLELCRYMLTMMSKWVLEQSQFPTVKEKAGILIKMMSFEGRDDQLLRDYLDLIHTIYTDPVFERTELTVRLENAFLMGCRQRDPVMREKFLTIFDTTLVRGLPGRMQYLLGTQNWEYLADHYWISQVLDLLLGSVDTEKPLLGSQPGVVASSKLGDAEYSKIIRGLTVGSIITNLRGMLYIDPQRTHEIWTSVFRAAWRALPRKYQEDVNRAFIALIAREYNLRQASQRPNVIQSLLEGALPCQPQVEIPPHVVKYLGKTFEAWHVSMATLEKMLSNIGREDDSIREATQDALAESYADLSEDDFFYGLWRRRVVFAESNAAISYEQNGMWSQAQLMYETAQTKSRTGAITFTEPEYSLWEDHWVLCAEKLQQWDILTEMAKAEGNNDLLLECAWRLSDWSTEREVLEQALDSLSTTSTPRRRVFAAFMSLLKAQDGRERSSDFGRICDEAIQQTLRKWHSLPQRVTQAHVPLLQIFQQFVELQEASTIFTSLSSTDARNLDQKSTELKTLMQTWRERLPNLWDDILSWSDLVAWRQHVFGAVNKAYLPLVPQMQQQNGAQGGSTNSYAYRGYHETAWIINRFAHVARKQGLSEVCITSLTRIYTLPNIEIQEAFLKLREQAKCHFHNPQELGLGLDVINNTNLMFFAAPQKAAFFTLKGMFMSRLNLSDEANRAFATAAQMDLNLPKAWTEWGRFNDRVFREDPSNMSAGSSATSCYLQAAGLYKSAKTRKVLIRILWLLGFDDAKGTISQSFDNFRGDNPTWYWITYIPQLLHCLSQREGKYARRLLMSIAKQFPQSLYFQLRTMREELIGQKRASLIAAQRAAHARQQMEQKQREVARMKEEKEEKDKEEAANAEAQARGEDEPEPEPEPESQKEDVGTKKGEAAQETATTSPMAKEEGEQDESQTGEGKKSASPAPEPSSEKSTERTTIAPAASASDVTEQATQSDEAVPAAEASDAAEKSSDTSAAQSNAAVLAPTSVAASNPAPSPAQANKDPPTQPKVTSATDATAGAAAAPPAIPSQNSTSAIRQPWEYVDEVLNILKTAFPLLALTMENVADQIQQRFKPTHEEDIYRLTNALLTEALAAYTQRATFPDGDSQQVPAQCQANIVRFAESLPAGPLKAAFEEKFVKSRPTLQEYVQNLQKWRDRYEAMLDKRQARYHLEHSSHYLVEFQHQRFDEVEVPGQYLKMEDNNADFVKIARFDPIFDALRSGGQITRRLTLISNKGSRHTFNVQLPPPRTCRREERIFVLLRLLNCILDRNVETRKRGLAFTVPSIVPLSTQLRLIETNYSTLSLQDIYERHCQEMGIGKEDPTILWVEKMRSTWASAGGQGGNAEMTNLRVDLLDEISAKMVPDTVLTSFVTRSMKTPADLWLLRKHFSLQMASTMFLTYCLFVSGRQPSRMLLSLSDGVVTMSEIVPTFHSTQPHLKSADATPFRLTPNIQHFMGPVAIEGILTASLVAMGRALSDQNRQLEDHLSIFIRDEVQWWLQAAHRQQQQAQAQAKAQSQSSSSDDATANGANGATPAPPSGSAAQPSAPSTSSPPEAPRDLVMANVNEVVKRASIMSCKHEINKGQPSTVPVSQAVIDLINASSSPSKLAWQEISWMPFM